VIAEGVETRSQVVFLRASGCGEGQGYYFSRPVAAEAFTKFLESGLPGTLPDPAVL
jgi:EAL domain-containing protein (putative c-di-GMP-specific phosphodiesterase class I)